VQYRLSETQAQEILQMRLQRLTGLEQDKIVQEYREVIDTITDLLDILARPERVSQIIEHELGSIRAEFGDARRSVIEHNATDLETEDLIAPQDMVVTLSHGGYIKSQPVSEYRAQKRGGRGRQAATTKEEDWIDQLFIANTHAHILCFSDRGRVYWLKVWEVPQGSRNARGKPIVNMFPLADGEKITVVLPVKAFDDEHFVFMTTSLGTVKKTPLTEFSRPLRKGIIAVDLDEGDFLIGAAVTDVVMAVPAPIFGYDNPLPLGMDSHIAAVALFGNGTRKVLGPVSALSPQTRTRIAALRGGRAVELGITVGERPAGTGR
jgi:DNA gyrase subunit A